MNFIGFQMNFADIDKLTQIVQFVSDKLNFPNLRVQLVSDKLNFPNLRVQFVSDKLNSQIGEFNLSETS